jgi:heme/copper-type cytochrome/quinol oxidase subunit 3
MRQETMWIWAAFMVFGLLLTAYMFYPRSVEPEVYERPRQPEATVPTAPVLPPVAPQVYEDGVMYKG